MAAANRKRLPRRRRSETRELLLAAGVLLVDEMTQSAKVDLLQRMFAHLTLDEVLDAATRLQVFMIDHPPPPPEAGESEPPNESARFSDWLSERRSEILAQPIDEYGRFPKASLYTVFESEADFHAELARRLYSGRSQEATSMDEVGEPLIAQGDLPPLSDWIRLLATAQFHHIDSLQAHVELGAAPYLGDPELARIMAESYGRIMTNVAAQCQVMLAPYGRRMRDGFTADDLFAALDVVFFGFAFRARVAPELLGPESERGARLFADMIEAIVLDFTEEG